MVRATPIASAALLALSLTACSSGGAGTASSAAPSSSGAAAKPAPSSSGTPKPPVGSGPAAAPSLEVGAAAPDVTFALNDGTTATLASMKGAMVLVYFYPEDNTPGCTKEAEGIRDAWKDFQAAGVKVVGVAMQDAKSHQAFVDQLKLPFPLAVDVDGALATAFHVPFSGTHAARQSFLVDKDGKIAAVWTSVKPAEHAAEVLAKAKGA